MWTYATFWLLPLGCVLGGQSIFSVNDDLFAYPQYELNFSPSYILENDAAARLRATSNDNAREVSIVDEDFVKHEEAVDYTQMLLKGRKYLCSIPQPRPLFNATNDVPSQEDQQKDLVRAADRGWQLLQDMEGPQCLYYSTGWWSYAFCYNSHVKQFHSLPPSPGAARTWPPQEDQTTPSYFLGKFDPAAPPHNQVNDDRRLKGGEVQTRADGNYLVQRLEGGTPCDLTGKNRKVEIEFHCHPQTTDRIGWIKETTTCSYLMVIYTPRLCNDVAFQPPRDSKAHAITCQEILTVSEAAALQEDRKESIIMGQSGEIPIMVGKIELGGMKIIGRDAKKLERGRIVMTAEEKAEIVVMQKDGHVQSLSRSKMKELNLKPEDIEDFKRELQKMAGSKDWKIERLEDANGQIRLLGIVSEDGNEVLYETAKDEKDRKGKSDKPKNGKEKNEL